MRWPYRVGGLQAFNENPQTDAKQQDYRLYTRNKITLYCCGDRLAKTTGEWDKEGGREGPGIYGTINMRLISKTRKSRSVIEVKWKGWGRPHRLANLGMDMIKHRTSVNIWHEVTIELSCDENGKGFYNVTSFTGSNFPSHRLWVNGNLKKDIVQGDLADLWTAQPGNPTFVN